MREVFVPVMGMAPDDVILVSWLKAPGEPVEQGDVLALVETSKAELEIEAEAPGTLGRHLYAERATIPPGTTITHLLNPGETDPGQTDPGGAGSGEPAASAAGAGIESLVDGGPVDRPRHATSPRQRRLAALGGAPAGTGDGPAVGGSGEVGDLAGRAVAADDGAVAPVDPAAVHPDPTTPGTPAPDSPTAPPTPVPVPSSSPPTAPPTPVPVPSSSPPTAAPAPVPVPPAVSPGSMPTSSAGPSGPPAPAAGAGAGDRFRAAVSASVVRSWQEIPHFAVTRELRVDPLTEAVAEWRAVLPGLTLTDLLLRAFALALLERERRSDLALGLAVATDRGVAIPVVTDVLGKGLVELVDARTAAVRRARQGKLTPDDGTVPASTLSNLGAVGVDQFTGVIPYGQSSMLTVGRAAPRPVVTDGRLAVATTMQATLNVDHRSWDGLHAGEALDRLARILRNPTLVSPGKERA